MNILKIIQDIFFDTPSPLLPPTFHTDTEHYRKELKELFLDEVMITTSYHNIKPVLEAFKYRSEREKGEVLLQYLLDNPLIQNHKEAVLVSLPMHWTRYFIRGFDHIAYLTKNLAKISGASYQILLGTQFTFRQSQLSKQKRINNRIGKFFIKRGRSLPEEVILIDDVISTGSTANECARVLKEAGVKKVYGLFLATNRD